MFGTQVMEIGIHQVCTGQISKNGLAICIALAKLVHGIAFSAEPGFYIPGKSGLGIKDIVVVDSASYAGSTTAARS